MKKLFITALFAVMLTGIVASCETDNDSVYDQTNDTTAEDKDLEEDKG